MLNCKRLRAPPRQPGRVLRRSLCRSRDPPRHRFAAPPRGSHGGGGGSATKFCMGGRVGLRGRRLDPGLLAPGASRQEAEANLSLKFRRKMCSSSCSKLFYLHVPRVAAQRLLDTTTVCRLWTCACARRRAAAQSKASPWLLAVLDTCSRRSMMNPFLDP